MPRPPRGSSPRNALLPLDFGALDAPRLPMPPVMGEAIVPESPSRGMPVTAPGSSASRGVIESLNRWIPATNGGALDPATRRALSRITEDPDIDAIVTPWLHGKATATIRGYVRVIDAFLAMTPVPLEQVTIHHIHAFVDTLHGSAEGSVGFAISAVKSLLTFGNRIDLLPRDVGKAVRYRRFGNDIADHILTEEEARAVVAATDEPRDRVLLQLAYSSGMRVSEIVGLRWGDLHDDPAGGGRITVRGKGKSLRHIHVQSHVWTGIRSLPCIPSPGQPLDPLPGSADVKVPVQHRPDGSLDPGAPVFRVRDGTRLGAKQVYNVVRKAAKVAGVGRNVTPHWFRHSNASHALDNGAPIHVVAASLGHKSIMTTMRYLHAKPGVSTGAYIRQ